MRLKNKIALITGGGTGIGRATALLFAKEGAAVAVSGRREHKLLGTVELVQKNGGRAYHAVGDISKVSGTEKIVKETVREFGGLDILVNNAGVFRKNQIADFSEDDYDYIMNVNLKGTFFMCKYAVPELKRRGGSIINISSISAIKVYRISPTSAYAASKAGVNMLTKALAIELAPYKIRVNCICPAVVETELFETLGIPQDQIRERMKMWEPFHPLGRNAKPEEIAYAVLYFASDEASWATGSIFTLDGGVTAE
ncbi:MAG TPA: glucose 1-dehydrogenase [Thermodesulfobacteriota bacterium]|nr:glucose 1-dehydrogenase [Thermodesulfobacteriota bacterium]